MKAVVMMPIKLHNEKVPGINTKLIGSRRMLQCELDRLRLKECQMRYVFTKF